MHIEPQFKSKKVSDCSEAGKTWTSSVTRGPPTGVSIQPNLLAIRVYGMHVCSLLYKLLASAQDGNRSVSDGGRG